MQNVLQISRRIDYALRAMHYLARQPEGAVLSFKKIAKECRMPKDFLGKIMRLLTDRGLVHSMRGPTGGYRLARMPWQISYLEVVEAVEGPVALNICLENPDRCDEYFGCAMAAVWRDAQTAMLEVLRERTLGISHAPAAGVDTQTSLDSVSR